MPRTARSIVTGCPYHCMNRGNGRRALFRKPGDYLAFCHVIAEGLTRYDVDLYAYCLMPNHWHLLLSARADGAVSALLGWVGVTHVRRHHEHHGTRGHGHVYQGRFKSFPVAVGRYFRSTAHYVEANARRAKLVDRAADWAYGSAAADPVRDASGSPLIPLAAWPCPRPSDWARQLDADLDAGQLTSLRTSVARGRPFGGQAWVEATAAEQGLTSSLRTPGRPRKPAGENQ